MQAVINREVDGTLNQTCDTVIAAKSDLVRDGKPRIQMQIAVRQLPKLGIHLSYRIAPHIAAQARDVTSWADGRGCDQRGQNAARAIVPQRSDLYHAASSRGPVWRPRRSSAARANLVLTRSAALLKYGLIANFELVAFQPSSTLSNAGKCRPPLTPQDGR